MKKKKIKTPPSKKRPLSVLKGIASGFIWGLGQLFNKQFLKAFFFFVFFAAFIGIELGTSNYFKETDPYDKIVGKAHSDPEDPSRFIQNIVIANYKYERHLKGGELPESFQEFDNKFMTQTSEGKEVWDLTEDDLIVFLASQLRKESLRNYTNITDQEDVILIQNDEPDHLASERAQYILKGTLYRNLDQSFYRERNYVDADGKRVKDYVKVDFATNIADENSILESSAGMKKYEKTGNIFFYQDKLYVEVKADSLIGSDGDAGYLYIDVENPDEEALITKPDKKDRTDISYKGPIYKIGDKLYEYYEPGLMFGGKYLQYKGNDFTEFFKNLMVYQYSDERIGKTYTSKDYTKFLVKVYFNLNPELKQTFEKDFDNFFYDKAGFFIQSYWGVFTLGTTKKIEINGHQALHEALVETDRTVVTSYDKNIPIMGHVSTHILLQGLIGMILSFFFFIFMAWSIVDAYRTSEKKYNEMEIDKGFSYFKEVYEQSFEYIVLSPALFVLAFISIMPILFGFLLAFTSISGKLSMIDTFDYVGFKNFFALFNFADSIGASFGRAFWKVLLWTVIWAIMSTVTCFFGGLFQALIINSDRVHFKKFWRTILILPWAMPALLSQMVFSVMFSETGYINAIFNKLGLYSLFQKMGWLGQEYSTLRGAERLFYIGNENIQWFTNPFNPAFVRTVLIIVNIWLGFPYFMALMSGIMTSIDKTLYEAADIDGASRWQKLRHITMPLILYSTAPILIMTFSGNFNNFGVIYFITGGGPNEGLYSRGFAGDTDILISWMYKLTVDESIYNLASVFSVLIFIFVGSITAWNLSRTKAFQDD